jgi:integrase
MQTTIALKTRKQEKKLLKAARRWNPKYELLFLICLKSGLRVSDALKLRAGDFHPTKTQITVTEQKTGKERKITFKPGTHKKIITYIGFYHIGESDFLIFRRAGERSKPLSRVRAWQVIKKISTDSGLEGIGTHSMRKTYAKNLYKKTKSIKRVQQDLNHKYATTTYGYLAHPDEVEKIIANLN